MKIDKVIDIIEIDNGLFKILTNSNDNNKIVSKNKKQKDNWKLFSRTCQW